MNQYSEVVAVDEVGELHLAEVRVQGGDLTQEVAGVGEDLPYIEEEVHHFVEGSLVVEVAVEVINRPIISNII